MAFSNSVGRTIGAGIGAAAIFWVAAATADIFDLPPSNACAPAIDAKLSELKISRAEFDILAPSPRYSPEDESPRFLGYDVWANFKSCRGSLVIDLDASCSTRQVYTRGQCSMPGVKAY